LIRKTKVIVLMGGYSPEHEVSLASGRLVVKNLNRKKYEVFPLVISNKPVDLVELSRKVVQLRPMIVFLALHGPFGEDGRIQAWLELLGVPYTGSGVLASAVGMDKIMFKKLMQAEKIKTPRSFVLTKKADLEMLKQIGFPLVVKPSNQGSSVGVSIVRQKKAFAAALNLANQYSSQVIIEEYIAGMEVTAGILGNRKRQALPLVEILPKGEFFDYRAKYTKGASEEIVPARISSALTEKIQRIALKVYQLVGCRGFGRVDFRLKGEIPYVLEINTIPGLTSASLLPKEAAAAGMAYPEVLDKIIELALEK
jgi:D-alanine-D-alanine ligase